LCQSESQYTDVWFVVRGVARGETGAGRLELAKLLIENMKRARNCPCGI
jgi:hypothetical protein